MTTQNVPQKAGGDGSEPRIGVYVCQCGLNIAQTVDCRRVSSFVEIFSDSRRRESGPSPSGSLRPASSNNFFAIAGSNEYFCPA